VREHVTALALESAQLWITRASMWRKVSTAPSYRNTNNELQMFTFIHREKSIRLRSGDRLDQISEAQHMKRQMQRYICNRVITILHPTIYFYGPKKMRWLRSITKLFRTSSRFSLISSVIMKRS
jgi:hypothetical protein